MVNMLIIWVASGGNFYPALPSSAKLPADQQLSRVLVERSTIHVSPTICSYLVAKLSEQSEGIYD